MVRKQFNVRLPPEVIRQINDLAKTYGSQSNVIIIAISEMYDKHNNNVRAVPAKQDKTAERLS